METTTLITLAWELHTQGLTKSCIAERLGKDRGTIRLWLDAVAEQGLLPFLEQHQKAKKQPRPARQVRLATKQLVWAIREREHDCCGQKIAYFLDKEHQISLSVPKIYEVLSEKYTLRSKWAKNQKRGEVPQAEAARQVIQMDTVHFGQVFAFTAVDIFSREADVLLRPSLLAVDGEAFLKFTMGRRFDGFTQTIQTDGGSEFEAEFARAAHLWCRQHRIARPYKKNEQSFIESFNRTVRSECLGWAKYRVEELPELTQEVEAFLERYHYHRPHLAFTPMRPPLTRG
ncbi:MAG: integrase core domain-containing protein [Armatimonadota bacterium]|nr:integrase core domain-containing protein [Armatimonadota bacterium]